MIGTLRAVVLDTPDVTRLAAFYTALGGWTERDADDDWITMVTGDGWRIAAQLSPDHVPPQWPDPAYPQQAHLDLRVPDLDAGSAKAVELGAELLRKSENWYTLADPAGHPFDLCLFPAKQETTLMGVMLDCPDAKELSTFYAELLGKPVTYQGEGMAMIGEDGAQPVMFQQVTDYRAPRWPDPTGRCRPPPAWPPPPGPCRRAPRSSPVWAAPTLERSARAVALQRPRPRS